MAPSLPSPAGDPKGLRQQWWKRGDARPAITEPAYHRCTPAPIAPMIPSAQPASHCTHPSGTGSVARQVPREPNAARLVMTSSGLRPGPQRETGEASPRYYRPRSLLHGRAWPRAQRWWASAWATHLRAFCRRSTWRSWSGVVCCCSSGCLYSSVRRRALGVTRLPVWGGRVGGVRSLVRCFESGHIAKAVAS